MSVSLLMIECGITQISLTGLIQPRNPPPDPVFATRQPPPERITPPGTIPAIHALHCRQTHNRQQYMTGRKHRQAPAMQTPIPRKEAVMPRATHPNQAAISERTSFRHSRSSTPGRESTGAGGTKALGVSKTDGCLQADGYRNHRPIPCHEQSSGSSAEPGHEPPSH